MSPRWHFKTISLGPCLSLYGGLLLFLTIFVTQWCSGKEDVRLICVSPGCFGTFFDMAPARDALMLSFKHSLFSTFCVILPPFVATLLRHMLQITVICSTSSLLYANHRQRWILHCFSWKLIRPPPFVIPPAAVVTYDVTRTTECNLCKCTCFIFLRRDESVRNNL